MVFFHLLWFIKFRGGKCWLVTDTSKCPFVPGRTQGDLLPSAGQDLGMRVQGVRSPLVNADSTVWGSGSMVTAL